MTTLNDDLVAYWKLDEESGTRIDSVGNNDLADNATVLYSAGKVGNAAEFEADNTEYLSIADNADISVGDIDFTVWGWCKFESLTTHRAVIGQYGDTDATRSWSLYALIDTTIYMDFTIRVGASGYSVKATNFGAVTTATWYFVVAWHDSVNDLIGISVNDTATTTAHTAGCVDVEEEFTLGSRAGGTLSMDGPIDEVGFVKKVLSSTERTWLYNSGDGRTYPFPKDDLAGPLVLTGTATKKTSRALAGPLVLAGTAVKKAKRALAGPITFAGTLVGKAKKALAGAITFTGALAKYLKWILFARFRDYFLTAPQRFAISSNKVQMTARYRDYYLTAPEKK